MESNNIFEALMEAVKRRPPSEHPGSNIPVLPLPYRDIDPIELVRCRQFIPDLGGSSPADLVRLSYDIPYRHDCFRRADPDLAMEDECPEGTPKSLFNATGKRLATARGVRISQLCLTAADYRIAGALVDAKKISFACAGTLLEKAESSSVERDAKWYADLAHQMELMITVTGEELDGIIRTACTENAKAVADYRAGKIAAANTVFGWIMRTHKGLDPRLLREKLAAHLSRS